MSFWHILLNRWKIAFFVCLVSFLSVSFFCYKSYKESADLLIIMKFQNDILAEQRVLIDYQDKVIKKLFDRLKGNEKNFSEIQI